jgi:hypothetical protein
MHFEYSNFWDVTDVAGRMGPSSMPEATSLKQLGSRFCVLAAESSDSDNEIWEEEGALMRADNHPVGNPKRKV